MFRRIIHDHWMEIVPIVSFVLTFIVFAGATIRSLKMKKAKVRDLSHLPLQD